MHFGAPPRTPGPLRCGVAALAKAAGLGGDPRLAAQRPRRADKHAKVRNTLYRSKKSKIDQSMSGNSSHDRSKSKSSQLYAPSPLDTDASIGRFIAT